jgi:outer membrane lipoprotein SlyB
MNKVHRFFAFFVICVASAAQAQSPREQYTMDVRDANARYAEDRSICAEEKNQGQRMKCLRIAKSEQQASIASAKARMGGGNAGGSNKMACLDCGKVTNVTVREQRGESNALGMLAGGAAGALLGNQVGSGSGKKVATVAGAIGGAYAGKKVQENMNGGKVWSVEVQYDSGERRSFDFNQDPGVQRGDRIKNAGQSITRI